MRDLSQVGVLLHGRTAAAQNCSSIADQFIATASDEVAIRHIAAAVQGLNLPM
jgi:hypothetical protein